MINIRVSPFKRVVAFIMALLMVTSAIVYLDISSDAAQNLAIDSNNWRGWYECFRSDLSTIDSQGNIVVPTWGTAMLGNYNPLSFSSGKLISTNKHNNAGWDDFVAVTSNNPTVAYNYSITVNIKTGGTDYCIADGGGLGSFSIGIMNSNTVYSSCFDNYLWGINYGLAGSEGYVVTFNADPKSHNYYDYYSIYKTTNGAFETLISKGKLTSNLAMANGTSAVTLALSRTSAGKYKIVLSNTNGTKQDLLTDQSISDTQSLYYGVGAFCSGINLVEGEGKIVTSPAFEITSVNDCSGSHTPANHTGSHNYAWSHRSTYSLFECSSCGHVSKKGITVTYNANGGILTGGNTQLHSVDSGDSSAMVSFTPANNIIPTPANQGYEFSGWSTDAYATEPDQSFSSANNLTLHAVYKKTTYTLTLDPLGGVFEDGTTANKTYPIHNGDLYLRAVGDMPNPTKRGYSFVGWDVNNSTYYAPNWSATASYQAYESLTFVANWSPIQGYNLTFDTNGGIMPSNYDTSYLFYPDEKFDDIIGGFPVPTKDRHRFLGWQRSDYASDFWETGWGTQPYTFGKNITLIAQWEEIPGYTLTLDAGKGRFENTGDHIARFVVPPDEKFVDNNIPFVIPVRDGYTFVGWQWDNRTDHLWTDGWGTQPYYWDYDVTFHAVWTPNHTHVVGSDTLREADLPVPDRYYHEIICSVCNEKLYGFKASFYSRNNGIVDLNNGTKWLNRDILLTDVFEDVMMSACNTYVLSETPSVTVKLKFDPLIKGATSKANDLFLGWSVGGPMKFNDRYQHLAKNASFTIVCDDTYYAYYDYGCNEYVFDSTNADQYTLVDGSIQMPFARLVQEDRNYALVPVHFGQNNYYDDYIDYVPTMKTVDGIDFRATNTWYFSGFGLNAVTLHNYDTSERDIILLPGTRTGDTGATQGAPLGRMSTYYANNKGAKYVEAHYDPNYRYSGTMYYRYEKEANGNINMYPEFTFDVRRDPADNNPDWLEELGQHPDYLIRNHDEYHKEFDAELYFQNNPDKTVVIVKDPRMYTTYLGKGDPYKFIRIVAEPHGDVYQSMSQNADGSYNINDYDPDIREHEIHIEALHSSDYQGGSYIVYKATNGNHKLPDYRLARDYTKQHNEYSSRYPLYYSYRADHNFADYGVTNYDNRYPTMFDRGDLTDRGFEPIDSLYEPLWAYAGGGWSSFDVVEVENETSFKEEFGGFKYILQYQSPERPLLIESGIVASIPQYSAYQQWDNKVAFNANVDESSLTNAELYGDNEAYLYTVSYGNFYMPDANLFTRDRYVIVGWATSKERADAGEVDFDCGQQLTAEELCGYTYDSDEDEFVFTSFDENGDAPTLYAVWKSIVNFTLVEGETDYGANPFAEVRYRNALTGEYVTSKFNATKTVKTYSGSTITVNVKPAPTGYVYSYLTINQNIAPLRADRILTTDLDYKFTIFDDTAMTAQYIPLGTNTGFYIDRNNKLLRNNSDAWRLYTSDVARAPAGVASSAVHDNALYYTYNNNGDYSVTVSGSTYQTLNGDHNDLLYDDVITLMTGPVDSSGNKFVGWKIGNEYVSFDLVYKHRVTSQETVTAVYSETVERFPTISIVHTVTENSRDNIIAQRTAPEGYTLLETGFIITKNTDEDVTFDDLYDENGNYYKIVSTDTDKDGAFKVILSNSTYYGIAYAYYRDVNDNIVSCVTETFKKE